MSWVGLEGVRGNASRPTLSLFWGLPWRGRRVRAGSSIYFCGEGQAYAGRRVKAWLQHNAERIRDILPKSDRVFSNRKERQAVETFYQNRNLAPLWSRPSQGTACTPIEASPSRVRTSRPASS